MCGSKRRSKLKKYRTSMRFWITNIFFNCWLGKISRQSAALAGNFPTNVARRWSFSYHPAGSVEQIFFPSNRKKILKRPWKRLLIIVMGCMLHFVKMFLWVPLKEAHQDARQNEKLDYCEQSMCSMEITPFTLNKYFFLGGGANL